MLPIFKNTLIPTLTVFPSHFVKELWAYPVALKRPTGPSTGHPCLRDFSYLETSKGSCLAWQETARLRGHQVENGCSFCLAFEGLLGVWGRRVRKTGPTSYVVATASGNLWSGLD